MTRTARPLLLAAVAVGMTLAAGCGGTVDATASAPASSSAAPTTTAADPTAWADGVCGSLLKFTDAASKRPNIDTSNPRAAISGLSSYLGTVVGGADAAIAGLKSAGPSPVAGGDESVTKLTGALTGYRTSFDQARTKLDAANPNDPAAIQDAVAPLQSVQNAPNPLADLKASPELDRAAENAPNCRKVAGEGATAGGQQGGN